MNNFLKISKRKIVIFLIVFFLISIYLPTIKCFEEYSVSPGFCKLYGLCEVERYYSLWSATINYNKLIGMCDAFNYPLSYVLLLDLVSIVSAYLISCVIESFYKKYRDK
ncbi:hypothetical protein A3K73_02325 [Candidatus Pacearchaeota archaeon RBG_13_36_9]|nr:MAG: hypothetical protein A3K73_02325 [Candidatus Pacearchaeota archaeon RBG_13_36_9]